MNQFVRWYDSRKETKLGFQWLFLFGTVLAAILPFVPYIEEYSPLRASREWLQSIWRNPLDGWMQTQLFGVTFLFALPLLLWRARIIFIGEPSRGEIIIGYCAAILCVIPIASSLGFAWIETVHQSWTSWSITMDRFSDCLARAGPTAILITGAWVTCRLWRRNMNSLLVEGGIVCSYAANLLLCTVIFHPFRDGWPAGCSSIGYFLGLPVLLLMLTELVMLGMFARPPQR